MLNWRLQLEGKGTLLHEPYIIESRGARLWWSLRSLTWSQLERWIRYAAKQNVINSNKVAAYYSLNTTHTHTHTHSLKGLGQLQEHYGDYPLGRYSLTTTAISAVLPELAELKGEPGHYSSSPHCSLPQSHVPHWKKSAALKGKKREGEKKGKNTALGSLNLTPWSSSSSSSSSPGGRWDIELRLVVAPGDGGWGGGISSLW